MNKRQETFWTVVATWLLMLLAMLLLFSCKSTEYIPVQIVKTDTVYQSKVVSDSVYVNDSTIVKVAGDTVFMERWHTNWRERILHDTLYHLRTDTVTVAYDVPVEVERELTSWQNFQLWFAKIIMALLIAAFIVWAWKSK